MYYETKDHHGLRHNPFKALVAPRPIGWISSLDRKGVVNLAPYSYFNAVATDPPVLIFSAGGTHSEGGLKDTVANVEATGEFVHNVATWETREAMNATSAALPRQANEFEVAGLTQIPSKLVKPPRVKESPVHMECRYLQTVELPSDTPGESNRVVFGQVVAIHIDDAIITDGMIDWSRFKQVARLGYMDYTVVDKVFSMQRPG
jgi:flavin reductase (DIM6/NTAB) family NADH-FMN oxidoreductase RutF